MQEQIQYHDLIQPALVIGAAGIVGTLGRWRHWYNPPDLLLADGSPDPRAGKISRMKIVADFATVPSLVIIGTAVLPLHFSYIQTAAVVGVVISANLGAAFFLRGFEKLRDGAVSALLKRIGGA